MAIRSTFTKRAGKQARQDVSGLGGWCEHACGERGNIGKICGRVFWRSGRGLLLVRPNHDTDLCRAQFESDDRVQTLQHTPDAKHHPRADDWIIMRRVAC